MSGREIAVFAIEIALVLIVLIGATFLRLSDRAIVGMSSNDEQVVYLIFRDLAGQTIQPRPFIGENSTICFSLYRKGSERGDPSPVLIEKLNALGIAVFKPRSLCGRNPSNLVVAAYSEIGDASQEWMIVNESELAPSGLAYHVSQSASAIKVERGRYYPGM